MRVGPLAIAQKLGGKSRLESRLLKDAIKQCRYRLMIFKRSPFVDQPASPRGTITIERVERFDLLATPQAAKQITATPSCEKVKTIIAESEKGAPERTGKCKRVFRVFDHRENVDHILDLLTGIKRSPADDMIIEPFCRQCRFV